MSSCGAPKTAFVLPICLYERGKALNMAEHFEIDAVIDPVESRRWILSAITPR